MNRIAHTKMNEIRRKNRVRKTISGTSERPRLAVSISSRNVIAQIIDDSKQKTLAYVTTVGVKALDKKTMIEKADWVGVEIAKNSNKSKVTKVVFDRNGRLYHGKIKALAESARKNGLEF